MTKPPAEDLNAAFVRLTNLYKAKQIARTEYRRKITELVTPHKKRLEELAAAIARHDPKQDRTR